MKTIKQFITEETILESIQYHINNDIAFSECIFRPHSESFYLFYEKTRKMFNENKIKITNSFDLELLKTDIGEKAIYENNVVPLDIPLMEEDKDVELNKPKRGGAKKYYVYVKNDKGNIIKVQFGDTTGLQAKIDDPAARKSFVARHQCDLKNDKTTPGYWACRLPYYAKQLGLSGGGSFFW